MFLRMPFSLLLGVILLAGACAPQVTVAPVPISSSAPVPLAVDSASLQARWENIAKMEIASASIGITPVSYSLFSEQIGYGISKMIREGTLTTRVDEAEQNLRLFVRAMLNNSTRSRDQDPYNQSIQYEVSEASFHAARGLCPIYPFCW
jgi:hypothetical protein